MWLTFLGMNSKVINFSLVILNNYSVLKCINKLIMLEPNSCGTDALKLHTHIPVLLKFYGNQK